MPKELEVHQVRAAGVELHPEVCESKGCVDAGRVRIVALRLGDFRHHQRLRTATTISVRPSLKAHDFGNSETRVQRGSGGALTESLGTDVSRTIFRSQERRLPASESRAQLSMLNFEGKSTPAAAARRTAGKRGGAMAGAAGGEASAGGVAEPGVEELERAADSTTARFGGADTMLSLYILGTCSFFFRKIRSESPFQKNKVPKFYLVDKRRPPWGSNPGPRG
jgi:hypothetical protein